MSNTKTARYSPRHRADVRNHRAGDIGLLRAVWGVFWHTLRWIGWSLVYYVRRTDWEMFRSAVIIFVCMALYVWVVLMKVK